MEETREFAAVSFEFLKRINRKTAENSYFIIKIAVSIIALFFLIGVEGLYDNMRALIGLPLEQPASEGELNKLGSSSLPDFFVYVVMATAIVGMLYSVLGRSVRRSTLSDWELQDENVREDILKVRKRIEKVKDEETQILLKAKEEELQDRLAASNKDNLRDENGSLSTDWRDPLLMSRRRLTLESSRLAARSSANLAIGIFVSIFVVAMLVFILFVGNTAVAFESIYSFWAFYGPRFALVVVTQFLAGFFLRMYVQNERDIQKNKNEITNLELKISAGMMMEKEDKTLGQLAKHLITEERNFVLEKKQSSVFKMQDEKLADALKTIQTLIKKS